MEASEKLPIPEGATIRALEDRLVIEHLEVADERAARVVRERAEADQPAAETVTKAIEIGARVLEREETAADVDYVRAEFERSAAGLRAQSAREIETQGEKLAEQIASTFGADRSTAVQHQIRDLVIKAMSESGQDLLRRLSAEDGAFGDFKSHVIKTVSDAATRQERQSEALQERLNEMQTKLVELSERSDAQRRIAEVEDKGTAKGRSFEERVHLTIESIAGSRGDVAHHVGDTQSEEGGKKGDTLVEIGAAEGTAVGRLAFEAKSDRALTRPEAWRELNGAMQKRGAGYAVLVVAGEACVPSNTQPWLEYEGNKMIVTVDPEAPERFVLEAAYTIARSRVLAKGEQELKVDAAGVRDAVAEALAELRAVSTVKKHLTGVTNSADNARGALGGMEERLKVLLARIDELVATADD